MKKILYYLPSIIFNVAETSIIILIGVLLKLNIQSIILIITLFAIIRMIFKPALHYKDWYRCLIWSTLFFLSLFVVAKVDFIISLCLTAFEAIILTRKGNVKDIFMWGGNTLNKEVFEWVKFNQNNDKLIEYENNLKNKDKRKYYIFIYRFKEFKSYSEISKLMDIDIQRVSDEVNIMSHFIEYSIRLNKDEN